MSGMTHERDVFCADCGALIDHQRAAAEFLNSGMLTALLTNDAVHAHRAETGCPCGRGWRLGEWTPINKEAAGGVA